MYDILYSKYMVSVALFLKSSAGAFKEKNSGACAVKKKRKKSFDDKINI